MTIADDGVVEAVAVATTSGLTALEKARGGSTDAVRIAVFAVAGSAVEEAVTANGYRAIACRGVGDELLANLERAAPHAVVLDASGPNADMIFTSLLQARRHPPVIVVDRSLAPRRDSERWLAAGADDCLPFEQLTAANLRRAVESSIARGRARELRHRVGELDRLAAIATLAAGVAHEVNNPAAYVLMNLNTCRDHVATVRRVHAEGGAAPDRLAGVLDEMSEMLEDNIRGLERIVAIVQSLRSFARPEPDLIEPVDLAIVCREVSTLLISQLRHKARVSVDLTPVPTIDADARKLTQVVIDLLVGAAEAIPTGETDHEIRLRLRHRAGWIELSVFDSGRELTREQRARVFEPFSEGRRGSGGLGLATVHSVVQRLGGRVDVSAVGGGTEFMVRLPIVAATAAPRPLHERGRVLIIDDEVALTRAMHRQLRSHHDVVVENQAAAGLARALDEEFDVILCDVMMPGHDGLGFLDTVRRERPALIPRLVLMSAGTTETVRDMVLARGGYLIDKPVPLDALLGLITSVRRRIAG